MVGMNDLIRPGRSPVAVSACVDAILARLAASGARVVTVTYPDVVRLTPLAHLVVPRLLYFNARLRDAVRLGVTVVDLYQHAGLTRPRDRRTGLTRRRDTRNPPPAATGAPAYRAVGVLRR